MYLLTTCTENQSNNCHWDQWKSQTLVLLLFTGSSWLFNQQNDINNATHFCVSLTSLSHFIRQQTQLWCLSYGFEVNRVVLSTLIIALLSGTLSVIINICRFNCSPCACVCIFSQREDNCSPPRRRPPNEIIKSNKQNCLSGENIILQEVNRSAIINLYNKPPQRWHPGALGRE